jgi:hypothetical protein
MIPPLLIILRFGRLVVPLPVVLLWPLLLALALLCSLALVFVPFRRLRAGTRVALPWLLLRAFMALRGLRLEMQDAKEGRVFAIRCC